MEHAFKLYEILDRRLREVVDIDKSQYGFISGRETINAAFVLRRFYEKFRVNNKCYIFLDLEKTFDRGVPREVIRFALRQKSVPEYLVNGTSCLYKVCKTAASVDGELSSSFSVKVGVHQGFALSPLLFIMVKDVVTEDMRDGLFMELLHVCKRSCFEWRIIK